MFILKYSKALKPHLEESFRDVSTKPRKKTENCMKVTTIVGQTHFNN